MVLVERRKERRIGQREILDKRKLVITIDGATGTGKWALANSLAQEYGLTFINTGTSIRALALLAIEHGIVQTDETNVIGVPADFSERVIALYDGLPKKLTIAPPTKDSHTAQVLLGERDMLDALVSYNKQMAIENLSSMIAATPQMRERLYTLWKDAAERFGGVVVVGRKTGVDLFPNAHLKIFLHANPTASAGYRETRKVMATEHVNKELDYVVQRDHRDGISGLLDKPADAFLIDTSPYITDPNGMQNLSAFVQFHLNSKYLLH